MLNTYQMSSANLNRLNLGTRSLVVLTGVNNNGKSTLRASDSHDRKHVDSPRDGMPFAQSQVVQVASMRRPDPIGIRRGIPCPTPVDPWSVVDPVVRPWQVDVRLIAPASLTPSLAAWPVTFRSRASQADPARRAARFQPASRPSGFGGTSCLSSKSKSTDGRCGRTTDPRPMERRATATRTQTEPSPAAASTAAAGG